MRNPPVPTQLSFTVDGMVFRAQAWGDLSGFPVLALHGWLDNSASFSALAPLLPNLYIVAIDMAGHGQSSHRLGAFPYHIWEDVAEIFTIADQLGWQQFGLLGHSRGGIIATLAAGTFPERITHLALIEGLFPEYTQAVDSPAQLATSIQSIKQQLEKPRTLYPDIETAIHARARGMFPLSYGAAKALTERGVVQSELGLHWGTDQRLWSPSAVKLLPEQFAAFIHRITIPIKLILADDGMPKLYPPFKSLAEQFSHITIASLAGGHHLHMETEVAEVAAILESYFTVQSE